MLLQIPQKSKITTLILTFLLVSSSAFAFFANDNTKDLPATTKVLPLVNTDNITILKQFEAFQDIGKQSGQQSIENAVRAYLANNPSVLGGLTLGDLRMKGIQPYKLPYKDMYYIEYVQQKDGHDVEFSSVRVTASSLRKGDTLIYVRSQVFPNINNILDASQPHPVSSMLEDAADAVGLETNTPLDYREEHIISIYGEENDALALKTMIIFNEKPDFIVVVGPDGVEGVRDTRLHANVSGTIQGRGHFYFTSASQPLDTLPLAHTDVTLNSQVTTTNQLGRFVFTNQTAGNVTGRLRGAFADVTDLAGSNLSFNTFVPQNTPTTITLNPTGSNEYDTAEVNAFYHTNLAHDWVKARTNFTAIDYMLPVSVNNFGECNAYFSSTTVSMLFYAASGVPEVGSCPNTAFDSIIYHEYGHFVDHQAQGISPSHSGKALSEGWGDVFAAYISGQPYSGQTIPIARSADNQYLYPSNEQDEIHALGKALSGFAWDLQKNMTVGNTDDAVAIMTRAELLMMAPMIGNAQGIPEAVFQVVLADDDDNNLSNGTPNFSAISAAAEDHHLYPFINPVFAAIAMPERNELHLSSSTPQVTVSGNATHSNFSSYQLSYGAGKDPASWISIGPAVTTPVTNGTLGTWTLPTTPGTYTLRLVVNTTTPILKYQYLVPVHINVPWLPIHVDSNDHNIPHSDGQSIVWLEEDVSGQQYIKHRDINGAISTIPVAPFTYNISGVKVSGPLVIWSQGNGEILVYNTATGQSRQLFIFNAGRPDISGNYIVWAAYNPASSGTNIFIHDYAADLTTTLPGLSPAEARWSPSIDGNQLVYERHLLFTNTIDIQYVADITAPSIIPVDITSDPAIQFNPAIDGNIIAYQDDRHGNYEIYAYDLATSTEHRISNTAFNSLAPDVSGNIIVWTEMDGTIWWALNDGGSEVWYHNLSTSQTMQMTSGFEAVDWSATITDIPGFPFKLILWQSTVGGGVTQSNFEGTNIFGTLVP